VALHRKVRNYPESIARFANRIGHAGIGVHRGGYAPRTRNPKGHRNLLCDIVIISWNKNKKLKDCITAHLTGLFAWMRIKQ
jgi:hypothetical protein